MVKNHHEGSRGHGGLGKKTRMLETLPELERIILSRYSSEGKNVLERWPIIGTSKLLGLGKR
ncbi:hypothetical protein RvY_07688 [Ramazzottius varieornatus]|uniref:Uncharacterized protein n=1 Tax=Ramazzottius varieornatus TaxID=947166 RepID=A0A1D1V843_RAMVA|nr:hypothetical protein RvY_07688 [Ramazzottius varieornatus]